MVTKPTSVSPRPATRAHAPTTRARQNRCAENALATSGAKARWPHLRRLGCRDEVKDSRSCDASPPVDADPAIDRDDRRAVANNGAAFDREPALIGREVVMRRRGLRRALIG